MPVSLVRWQGRLLSQAGFFVEPVSRLSEAARQGSLNQVCPMLPKQFARTGTAENARLI